MAPPPIETHHAPASSTRHREREQKDERTSRKSTKTKGAHYEPNSDERSLTRGAASQKPLQAAFRHVAASIRQPSAEIHFLWGVLHPAREARATAGSFSR